MTRKSLHFVVLALLLCSFSAKAQDYLTESFDGTTFPPTSWSTYVWYSAGSDGGGCNCDDWQRTVSYGGVEPQVPTHSGAGVAWYNSWDMYWGNESSLISPSMDFTAYTGGTNKASFWIYRCDDWNSGYEDDEIDIYAYSASWGYYYLTTIYDGFRQYPSQSSEGWYQYTVTIPSLFSSYTDVSLVFDGYSDYQVDQYLDDVEIYHIPATPTVSGTTTYCAGSTITLTASSTAPSPTYTWTGPGGFTTTGATMTRTGATTAMSGTYTCTVTSGTRTSPAKSVTVVVNDPPTISSVTNNGPVCPGTTLNLTVSATAPTTPTYSWTGPSGFTSTTQNPSLTPVTGSMAGTYTVTATSNNCPATGNTTVVVNVSPTFNVSSQTNPSTCTCNCGSITLSGLNPSTAYTLNYTKNSTPITPLSITSDASGNYVISGLSAGVYDNITVKTICTSVPAGPITLTNPSVPPTPSVTSNAPVCFGTTLTFSGSVSNPGLTWTWSGPAGFTYTSTGTTSNPSKASVTFADSGNYYYFVTDASGCSTTPLAYNVVVKPLPNTPTVSSNNAASPTGLCANQTLSLTMTTTTPPGSAATIGYLWTDPTGGTAYPNTAGVNTLSVSNVPANFAGNWTVYSTLNGCTSANGVTFYTLIKPIPGTPTLNSNSPICSGAGYNTNYLIFGVNDTTSGVSYTWSGPASITPNPNTKNADTLTNPGTGASGTYTVFATKNGCNSANATTSVTVNQTPGRPTVSPSSTSYCQYDASIPLTASGSNLLWHTASTGGPGSSSAPTPNTTIAGRFIWFVTQTTNYTGVSCESQPALDTVTIKTKPTAPYTTPSFTYCQGENAAQLTAIGANLLWYTTATGGTGSAVPITPSTTTAGTFFYYVSQTLNGCESDRFTIKVTVKPKPNKPGVALKQYCQNDFALPLSASGSNIIWYRVSSGGVGSPIAPTPITTYADTLYYYATQTVDGCESDRAELVVVVDYTPNALIVANQPYVCQYDSIFFTYFGNALANASYNWSMPTGATMLHGNSQGPVWIKFDSAGKRVVTLQVTNKKCKSPVTSYIVDVKQAPYAATNIKTEVCQDNIMNVSLGYANQHIDKYDWNFDGAEVVYGSEGGGPFGIRWHTPGQHVISFVAYTATCPSIPLYDTVTVHPLADAHIGDVSSSNICAGDSTVFTAERYNPAYLYQWLPANYFETRTNQGQVYGYIEHTGYITLKVTTQYGCTSTDSTLITAQPCCEVFFPNAFTPNGDGKNDVFRPVSKGNQVIKTFRVTNRWGQVMFETVTPHIGWDGKFNGTLQDLGTYYYYIKYVCANGKTFEEKGEVLLIK